MSKICIAILFITICHWTVSAGIEDTPIQISESLTLHSGDVITLQADDNTYFKKGEFVSCSSEKLFIKPKIRSSLILTSDNLPDEYSFFIVETAENDQIRLRAKDNDCYLRCYEENQMMGNELTCFSSPFILIEDSNPGDPSMMFQVVKTGEGDKIALKAANGKYIHHCLIDILVGPLKRKIYNLLIAESDNFTEDSARFIVSREGIDPDCVQSVSNIKFDYSRLSTSTRPTVFAQTNQTNDGVKEMTFEFNSGKQVKRSNKWTWEKGIELTIGTKLTGRIEIPGVGGGDAEISTIIKNSTKNTNEYSEEEIISTGWKQTIPIPGNTKLTAKMVGDVITVDIPYTALVTVTSKDGYITYTYPINGTYQSINTLNLRVDKKEEPLMKNVSQHNEQQDTEVDSGG